MENNLVVPQKVPVQSTASVSATAGALPQSRGPGLLPSSVKTGLAPAISENLRVFAKAPELSAELAKVQDKRSIIVEFVPTPNGRIEEVVAKFSGQWDGRLVKGAIRAIEREYKMVKHRITRANVATAAKK